MPELAALFLDSHGSFHLSPKNPAAISNCEEPTGVKGAAGALGRVEDAADVCGAGGGRGRRRGKRGAGRVGC